MTLQGVAATAPKHVDVDAVERELTALWSEIAPLPGEPEPATRACMSNLIVYAGSPAEARTLPEEIGTIVARHPARVLLLVADAAARGVEATVSALCHPAGGDGGRICSEHVTIEAARDAEASLPATARALLIGDLPSALWWASPHRPPAGGSVFHELASLAEQVIWDSATWAGTTAGLGGVRAWAEAAGGELALPRRRRVSDLVWRRLKPWRWLVAETLDPAREPGALAGLDEVELEHGPGAVVEAWLLLAWLAACLGWRARRVATAEGERIEIAFDTPAGALAARLHLDPSAAAELAVVRLGWRRAGGHGGARFARAAADRLEATLGARPSHVLAAPRSARAVLVARELPKRFRDPLLRESLAQARAMADAPAA